MTRTLTAVFLVVGLTASACAQTGTEGQAQPQTQQSNMQCSQEAGAIWDAVQQSQLQENQKNEVSQVLQQAQAQEMQGDQAGCIRIIEQVKVALGMQTAPDGTVPQTSPAPTPSPAPATPQAPQ